jgi:hypothetical protein
MAIAIPALVDAQINALRATVQPNATVATSTASLPLPPYARVKVAGDLLRILTDLIDSGTLTATGGDTVTFTDTGAFTGVNSLVGCTFTFAAATTTAALRDVSRTVLSNTVNSLVLGNAGNPLPASVAASDTGTLSWDRVDAQLESVEGGKPAGSSTPNTLYRGRALGNAMVILVEQLTGTAPTWAAEVADQFGAMNPLAGGGDRGSGGGIAWAQWLLEVRNAVAAYTAPA